MLKQMKFLLFSNLLLSVGGIELMDYFGVIYLQAGELREFTCEELDLPQESPANFYWSLGDRNFTGEVLRTADNAVETTFQFIPIIEDDNKDLRCWKDEEYDHIKLSIFKQELISVSQLPQDLPGRVSIEFSIYPPPTHDLITWRIIDVDGSAADFHPGTEDLEANIAARKIQDLGDHLYRFDLDINKLENISTKNISLAVVTQNMLKIVPVLQDQSTVKLVALAAPWWLWICVVGVALVFVAIFAIVFLVIRRRKKPRDSGRRSFNGRVYIEAKRESESADHEHEGHDDNHDHDHGHHHHHDHHHHTPM